MNKKVRFKIATLVESVRDLPSKFFFGRKGKLNIQEAINLVADKYKLSKDQNDYSFLVLVALHAEEPNSNGDAFPLEELKRYSTKYGCRTYETFLGKPHFIEHHQDGEPYGFILDSHLEEPKDDQAYVELVIAVDRTKDPIYGMAVKRGQIDKFSMGCTVGNTICSICNNKANTEAEFCDHIRSGKMQTFKIAESGEEKIAFEWCYDVVFDEISGVGDPADVGAVKEEELKAASRKIKAVTENEIVKFVKDNAESVMFSGAPWYKINWKGKIFSADDTRDLVLQIAKKEGLNIEASKKKSVYEEGTAYQPTEEEIKMDQALDYIDQNFPEEPVSMGPGYREWEPGLNPREILDVVKETLKKFNISEEAWNKWVSKDRDNYDLAIDMIEDRIREFNRPRRPGRRQHRRIQSTLKQKYREDKGRKEWALVSKSDPSKVLKWFGPNKPSEEAVKKEERRVQYYKSQGNRRLSRQWKVNIQISDIWEKLQDAVENEDEEKFHLLIIDLGNELLAYREEIVDEVNEDAFDELESLIETFEATADVEEFDNVWNDIYDWADANDVWIDTFGLPKRSKRINKKAQDNMTAPAGPTDTAPGTQTEKGWLLNLSKDVSDRKILDETSAENWFKDKYNRDPKEEERVKMRNLFSYKRKQAGQVEDIAFGKKTLDIGDKHFRFKERTTYKSLRPGIQFGYAYGIGKTYTNKGVGVATFLGYSGMEGQHGEGGVKYDSIGEAFSEFGVRSLAQLDAETDRIAGEKYGEDAYGHGIYMLFNDAEGFEWAAYIYNGRWALGSGAEIMSFFNVEKVGEPMTQEDIEEQQRSLYTNRRSIKEDKMKDRIRKGTREYFIKEINKTAGDVRYPGYRSWVVKFRDVGKDKVAFLGDKKETPFKKIISSKVAEEEFAGNILDDLVRRGLAFVIRKYALERFKSILEDGTTDKVTGVSPREDKVTGDGVTDKADYKTKSVERSITDDAIMDKASRRRALKINKYRFIDVEKVANKVLEFYKKYEKLSDTKAKEAIVKLFGDKTIKEDLRTKKIGEGDAIEVGVEHLDVPGLVEEVVNYYIEDMEMSPKETAEGIVKDFVEKDAPDEVKDNIKEEIEELAEEASEKEEKEEGGKDKKERPTVKEELEEAGEKAEELGAELPSSKEMGMEEVEVASSRKAKEEIKAYRLRLNKALKVAAIRQLLNIEPKGLFKIKAEIVDAMIGSGKFGTIKEESAVGIIERAFRKVLSTDILDELIDSADRLTELDETAFGQIASDVEGLMPVNVLVKIDKEGGNGKDKNLVMLNKVGSGIFKDDYHGLIRDSLPKFGLDRK